METLCCRLCRLWRCWPWAYGGQREHKTTQWLPCGALLTYFCMLLHWHMYYLTFCEHCHRRKNSLLGCFTAWAALREETNKRQAFAWSKGKIDCSSFCAISTAPQLAKPPPPKKKQQQNKSKKPTMSKSTTCLLCLWCVLASGINVSENMLAQNLWCVWDETFIFTPACSGGASGIQKPALTTCHLS